MSFRVGILAAALCGSEALRAHTAKTIDCYSKYDGKALLSLTPTSKENMKELEDAIEDLGCADLSNSRTLESTAICDHAKAIKLMEAFGDQVELQEKDAGAAMREGSGNEVKYVGAGVASVGASSAFYSDWRPYEDRMARVADAVANSGGVATLFSIGDTVEGRPINAVRLVGEGWTSGDARVVMSFQLHAREWIVGMAGVYAVEQIIAMVKANPASLAGVAVDIIPTMNPDGTIFSETEDRMWRKNRATNAGTRCMGVDLNRNWDPDWAGSESTSSNQCSDIYHGPSAFSEPETQALKNLIDESPVYVHLDVHSYGHMILAPWSYTMTMHQKRAEIDVLGLAMKAAIESVHGVEYFYGGSEVLYPASGVCPDYATTLGGFGFTYELRPGSNSGGNGFAPQRSSILPAAEECWAGIVASFEWVKTAPVPEPPVAPVPTPAPCPYSWCGSYCWHGPCQACAACR